MKFVVIASVLSVMVPTLTSTGQLSFSGNKYFYPVLGFSRFHPHPVLNIFDYSLDAMPISPTIKTIII